MHSEQATLYTIGYKTEYHRTEPIPVVYVDYNVKHATNCA
jgi:hypothetical protein